MPKIQASSALSRFKVIDLSRVRAGPNCVRILTDFGADVVRVEPPEGVDPNEAMFAANRKGGDFQNINRNKRSMTLNLKKEGAMNILKRMIAEADVVVENWRPDVKDRLGLDYESLKALNPRIILASISGFGQDGPYAWRPGFDQIIQGMGGLMSVTGSADAPPCKIQVPVVDIVTGYLAAVSVLAALTQREKTGTGQHLDISMFGSAVALQQSSLAAYLADQIIPERIGSAAPYAAPNEALRCADGWIMVAAYQPARWKALCEIVGVPEQLAREAFKLAAAKLPLRTTFVARMIGQ